MEIKDILKKDYVEFLFDVPSKSFTPEWVAFRLIDIKAMEPDFFNHFTNKPTFKMEVGNDKTIIMCFQK